MKKNKGITLIALVITIIVMLILAGVTITFVLGENGIIQYAKNSKEESIKASIKEEIELAIMDIQMEEASRGKEVTLERLAGTEQLLANKLPGITAELKNNQIEGEYKGYSYTIDDKFKVTINGKVTGMKIEYTFAPEGYTNQNLIITINASPLDGATVVSITSNENLEVVESNKSFKITENGVYKFTVVDSNQNIKIISIPVDKIDKDEPFGKIQLEVSTTFINGRAVANITIDDAKSGIGTSKWVVNKSNELLGTNANLYTGGSITNKETKIETQALASAGTYYLHVLAVDKVGNAKEYISDVITVKLAYEISTPQDLQNMKNNLSAEYFVTKDIDMTGFNFITIPGTFKGKLDGQGHTISNLKINNTISYEYCAIFRQIENAEIKNIVLKNIDYTSSTQNIGGFAGIASGNINFDKVGVEGKISATYSVGSLFGGVNISTINTINISDCYARTQLTSKGYDVGGFSFIGLSDKVTKVTIKNSYWSGSTNAKGRVGTLLGFNQNDNQFITNNVSVQNSYYNKDLFTLSVPEVMSGKGITTQEFRNIQNDSNWDFTNTWYIDDQGYPELKF